MKKYKIGCYWESYGFIEVEANSLEQAKEKIMDGPLPKEKSYVDDSFNIDEDAIQEM